MTHFKVLLQTTAAAQGEGRELQSESRQQQIQLPGLALPTEKMLVQLHPEEKVNLEHLPESAHQTSESLQVEGFARPPKSDPLYLTDFSCVSYLFHNNAFFQPLIKES